MAMLMRWFSRLALVLFLFVLALAAIWGYARLTSPTEAQREAIALMQRPPPADGENGWAILMDLPPAPAASLPASVDCRDGDDCIAHIETALDANAQTLEAWRPRLEAAATALRAPVFRGPEAPRADASAVPEAIPSFQPVTQLDALRALDFVRGNPAGALDATCQDALGAVRWATTPDMLIDAMIGIAVFRQSAALIADMRRRAPDLPLPASCAALAIAPDPAVEGMMCNGMRGEWHFLQRMVASTPIEGEVPSHWAPAWLAPLLHDEDWLLARSAERYASLCGSEAAEAARADRAIAMGSPPRRWVDRVAFPISIVLDDIAEPAHFDFLERQLDFVAQRRLLAAVLQMDAMDEAMSNAERFAAVPEALREGARPLLIDADGSALSVPLRARRSEQEGGALRLPLPARNASITSEAGGVVNID